ncbi:hypothetical protein [Paenibacillus amylolyticus]|uniref:hypothetical protein n=1 Tax=Paenibacillus amylolyticus TaxID=1451 RepID=UPI00249B246F|nr:hypothetical protein [Paenibacillus amylolyticus]WFA88125.1 hypothetical protein OGI70_14930 [Paenibacillus amylolyticus]
MAVLKQPLVNPESGWNRYDDNDSRFSFVNGTWSNSAGGTQDYNTTTMSTLTSNSEVRFNMTGNKLRIICQTWTSFSNSIEVWIDGKFVDSFTTAFSINSANGYRVLVFEKLNIGEGEHFVKLITKQAFTFRFDAVDIDSSATLKAYKEPVSKFLISSEDKTYSLYKVFGKPLIPLMDAYDDGVGSVIGSASYSTGYTWKAFDNDDTTAYGTNFTPDSSKPIYVGFRFNDPVCVKRYSFLAGLRTFKFMASNNGTTWDTLDTKTSLVSNTSTTQAFDIQNDKLYSYYKLEATLATSGNAWVSIFSVQFYGLMPSILLECPSSEDSYIQNGIDKGFQIDTVEELNVKQHIKEDSIPLGSGKLFRQPIDREKHQASKIIFG